MNPGASDTGTGAAGTVGTGAEPGGTLAAALAMIDRLPLTPAEKADAVRRILADPGAPGQRKP